VVLRYQEVCADRSHALVREFAVKLMSRKEKQDLVRGNS
jgi:predicted GIY-YIG superfamily endonuclease